MSFLLFVPGLKSEDSLAHVGTPNSASSALRIVAHNLSSHFFSVAFRSAANPFPPLVERAQRVSDQIKQYSKSHGEPGLIVASNVGAGILLKSFATLDRGIEMPHVIAYKPVFDPLNIHTTAEEAVAQLAQNLAGRKMASLTIIAAENDTNSEAVVLSAFKNAVKPHVKQDPTLFVVSGEHGPHHTKRLADVAHKQLFSIIDQQYQRPSTR